MSPHAPTLSVLLPSLHERLLHRTLANLEIAAGPLDYEVVVVSPFRVGAPRVTWVPERERKGTAFANQAAFEASRGRLVVAMADDASLAPNALDVAVRFHDERASRSAPSLCGLLTPPAFGTVFGRYYATFPVISRASIDAIGGIFYDPKYVTGWCDADLSLRVWAAGGRCEVCRAARAAFNPDRMGYPDPVRSDVWSPQRQADLVRFAKRWAPVFGRGWSLRFRDFNLDLPVTVLEDETFVNPWPADVHALALPAPFNVEVQPAADAEATADAVASLPPSRGSGAGPSATAIARVTDPRGVPDSGTRGRVLLVPLEFARWKRARSWSYAAGLGFEEGLDAHGFHCTVLPAVSEFPAQSPRSWLYHAPRLLAGQRFDQAWVWLTHTTLDDVFLEWLKSVAPIRVAVVMESMEYTPEEYLLSPHLLARRDLVDAQLRSMTHVLAMDEFDADGFERRLGLPAMWLPCVTPRRTLRTAGVDDPDAPATFVGDLYGRERAALLDAARLRSLIVTPDLPENHTPWPDRFDALQREAMVALADTPPAVDDLERHVAELRTVRRALYDLWLDGVRLGSASVNLPSLFKGYSSRVVESAGAGVPVVSWDPPHRPANRALFAPGAAIRLFERRDADTLARHLRELRENPGAARAQAEQALRNVAIHHTAERRVEQVLEWLRTGRDPIRPDLAVRQTEPDARHWFLPSGYRRREGASPLPPTEDCSLAYPLAARLARALGCTRLVDVGCPHPAGLVRAATELEAVSVCDTGTARGWARRCPHITWTTTDSPPGPAATTSSDPAALVLSALQFERAAFPDAIARSLLAWTERATAALVISVDRALTRGPRDEGPPTPPSHRQEWTASELAALLQRHGFTDACQESVPAGPGRRELTFVATIVVAGETDESERRRVQRIARQTIDTCVAGVTGATSYALLEEHVRAEPVLVVTPVEGAPDAPSLQAMLADGSWIAVHSARHPVEEATRWATRVAFPPDAPVVLTGLGLGYHAVALAARPGAGRVVAFEPLPAVVALARKVPATRDALASGRVELVTSWAEFKGLARTSSLELASVEALALPVSERLADADVVGFRALLAGAVAWARAGLDSSCKPFFHVRGISVVVSTYDRVDAAAALVERIATQEPCGLPVEILLVNDHGRTEVFAAARRVADRTGCALRTFDTGYDGYGLTLARNVGLRFAEYDTTVFLDDDLEIGSDLVRRYAEAPAGVRMGRIDFVYEHEESQRRSEDRRIALRGPDRVLAPWAAFEGFAWGGNCAVPTELALALGGFDEAFLDEGEEDLDFSVRAVRACHRPVAVPSALAIHRGLDQNGRIWLGLERVGRRGRANDLLARPDRGLVVNGGVAYWGGDRWVRTIVG